MKRWMWWMTGAAAILLAGRTLADPEKDEAGERRGAAGAQGEHAHAAGGGTAGFGQQQDAESVLLARLLSSSKLAEEFGLTTNQIKTLKEQGLPMREQCIDLRTELQKAGVEQARLMTEKTVDEKALMATVEKAGALSTKLAKTRIRQLLLFRKTLTPEQMEKMKTLMKRHLENRREGGASGDATADGRRDRKADRKGSEKAAEPAAPAKTD